MILREIIQRVQNLYSRGSASDDTRLSSRHIYNKLITVRSKLLSQKAKEKVKINQWNYQILPCIELELAPVHECPCLVTDNCKVLKSVYPIPRVLTDLNRHLIQSVTTLDGSYIFPESSWEAIKNQKGNKFTSNLSVFYIRDEHLYITYNKILEVVTLTALFGDPAEAMDFPSVCDSESVTDCISPLDKEFPVDPELADTLIQLTHQELVMAFAQMVEDVVNNATDNSGMRERQRR